MQARQDIEVEPGQRYAATRPYGYNGKELDRGQVFTAQPCRGNEKLGRLGYVGEVPKKAQLYQCSACGAEFVDEPCRRSHYKRQHDRRPLDPAAEDQEAEAEEKLLEQLAPIGKS